MLLYRVVFCDVWSAWLIARISTFAAIVTWVPTFRGPSVYQWVGQDRQHCSCKNGWTDRDAVSRTDRLACTGTIGAYCTRWIDVCGGGGGVGASCRYHYHSNFVLFAVLRWDRRPSGSSWLFVVDIIVVTKKKNRLVARWLRALFMQCRPSASRKTEIFSLNTHARLAALFRDYPGEPVPER